MSVKEDLIRQQIRESYSKVAEASNDGGGCGVESSCCGVSSDVDINTVVSTRMGYSEEDIKSTPQGADMGLGCGTPKAIASIQRHETVLDLGSGGGFDCFLAAQELAGTGQVIGVDMTPAMLSKARLNAEKTDYKNIQFRLGEIEHLPVADLSVDVIISNCVINLSPNKSQVFDEAFRVLKAGGRMAVSDVVASAPLPEAIKNDKELLSGCMAGASTIEEIKAMMEHSGFINISIVPKDESRSFIKDWAPGTNIEEFVISAYIQADKPAAISSADSCCA
ncbi:MAG: arsenite methyltransferase [Gammaproteobacteria bacterium]|nr:arsenite methyltransferase [Gammaproteobacteria bacterium]